MSYLQEEADGGAIKLCLTSPPVDGKANAAAQAEATITP